MSGEVPREWRALTLTQPWAEEVALGHKCWETRSWATRYRGWLAIHAARGAPRAARQFAAEERAHGRIPQRLPLGAIVAVALLIEVRPADEVGLEVSGLERRLGDYTPGRWAWRLGDVVRLPEPIAARGALGLWRPHPDVGAELDAILRGGMRL